MFSTVCNFSGKNQLSLSFDSNFIRFAYLVSQGGEKIPSQQDYEAHNEQYRYDRRRTG